MKKIGGILAAFIGVCVIIWAAIVPLANRKDPHVVVSTTATTPYVMTAPGVLNLVSSAVDVDITGPTGEGLTAVIGYSDDVAAYTDKRATTSITGLRTWEQLTTTTHPADDAHAADTKAHADAGTLTLVPSDTWVSVEQGTGKIHLHLSLDRNANYSLLAVGAKGSPLTLTFTWDRPASDPVNVPVLTIGVLLTIIGVLLLILDRIEGQPARPVRTGYGTGTAASKRDVQEKAEAALAAAIENSPRPRIAAKTGGTYGVGVIPVRVPNDPDAEPIPPHETFVVTSAADDSASQDTVDDAPALTRAEEAERQAADSPRPEVHMATAGAFGAAILPTRRVDAAAAAEDEQAAKDAELDRKVAATVARAIEAATADAAAAERQEQARATGGTLGAAILPLKPGVEAHDAVDTLYAEAEEHTDGAQGESGSSGGEKSWRDLWKFVAPKGGDRK